MGASAVDTVIYADEMPVRLYGHLEHVEWLREEGRIDEAGIPLTY